MGAVVPRDETRQACYREIHRYKDQLMKPYTLTVSARGHAANTGYLRLEVDGKLEIKASYAWDVCPAVRLFGALSARPGTDQPDRVICVPKRHR
jgi:hypothetical protein